MTSLLDRVGVSLADKDTPRPEELLREAFLTHQWCRGVPPPEACLKASDKLWIQKYLNYAA